MWYFPEITEEYHVKSKDRRFPDIDFSLRTVECETEILTNCEVRWNKIFCVFRRKQRKLRWKDSWIKVGRKEKNR
jgi:hypothetical protein